MMSVHEVDTAGIGGKKALLPGPVPYKHVGAPPDRGKMGSRAALPAISEQSNETRIKIGFVYISVIDISLTDLKSLVLNVATSCTPCARPILMISTS